MLRRAFISVMGAAAVLLLMALAAGPATAQKPTITVTFQSETFADEFLTEECGVEVTTTIEGRRIEIAFDRETGPQLVGPVNFALTATAGDNTFRFRDVGVDVLRVQRDGTVVLSIVGQVPFFFTGVLRIDPETEEVLFEPRHMVDTTRACAVLTG